MDSQKQKAAEKGKEAEVNSEDSMVSSETFVSGNNPHQDEPQKTPSVSSDHQDSLTTAGSYIYILEGKIGRIDRQESPIDIIGLCTDNFTTCNILVMFSKDRRRYVLAHMDWSLKEAAIQEQISWLGVEPSLFRICRTDYHGDPEGPERIANRCIPNLRDYFIPIKVDDKIESVCISYADDHPVQSPGRAARIRFHPNSILLALQHSITVSLNDDNVLSPVMFDGQQWVDYGASRLSDHAIKSLQISLGFNFNSLFTLTLPGIDMMLTRRLNLKESHNPIKAVSELYLYFQYSSLNQLTKSLFLAKVVKDFSTFFSEYDTCHFTATGRDYLARFKNASTYQELKDLVEKFDTNEMHNTIYSELLKHPKYQKKTDDKKKSIALVQLGTLAQFFKLATVCFELLFHKFLTTETFTPEKQIMSKDKAISLQRSEQQRGESSSPAEFISSSEIEKRLCTQTIAFFGSKISSIKWKEYPKHSLPEKYMGHQIFFFNMPLTENEAIGKKTAADLCSFLKMGGFDATRKNTLKGNDSIIVDLTTSKALKF